MSLIGGVFLALLVSASSANAANLENAWITMSNPVSGASSNHTAYFYHPTNTLGNIQFRYCVEPSGATCSDTGIANGSEANVSFTKGGADVSGDWDDTAVTFNGTADRLTYERDSVDSSATSYYVIATSGFTNPDFSNCNYTNNSETGTCYVRINTYTNTAGNSAADDSIVSLTVTQAVTVSARVDPTLTFRIAGIDPTGTTTVNGSTLTSGITPTETTLPFGNLTAGTPKYLGHSLTVTTNATNGYDITAIMSANMTGSAYGDDIDPFTGNSASFTADESWLEPTGTASGTDTGWLGVGTDDTEVSNRAPTSANNNLFFSLGTTATTVAEHTTSASSEIDNLVFGIEVNSYQEADNYTGTMRYQILPVY